MSLLGKVKAYFNFHGEAAELEVSAAEVKQGKVFLHPVDDLEHVWCVKAKAVDIFINPLEAISEDDVDIITLGKTKTSEGTEREPHVRDPKPSGEKIRTVSLGGSGNDLYRELP